IPWQRSAQNDRTIVARGNEGKTQQEFDVLLLSEQEHARDVNEHQDGDHRSDDRGNIEKRFAIHEKDLVGSLNYAAYPSIRKAGGSYKKGKGRALALR